MGQIVLPKGYSPGFGGPGTKPVGPVKIDWNNPLAHGLVACIPVTDTTPVELVTGKPLVPNGSAAIAPIAGTSGGLAMDFGTGDLESGWSFDFSHFPGAKSLTCGMLYTAPNTMSTFDYALSTGPMSFYTASNTDRIFGFLNSGLSIIGTGGNITGNQSRSFMYVHEHLTGQQLYIDGEAGNSASGSVSVNAGDSSEWIGRFGGNGFGFVNPIQGIFFWDRVFTHGEAMAWDRDPYQILKPANQSSYVFPTAGGDTNVLATTDTLIITEQGATVNAETSISATTASLVLTEQAASVTLGVDVLATTAALTLSEQASTIQLNKAVSATTDALILSEQAATVALDKQVAATTDSLLITENAATIALNRAVSATTDALVITENAATVTLVGSGTNVNATTVALTITEKAATVNAETNVSANTDSLVLTEFTAQIGLSTNVNAGTDSLVIVEQAATVTLPRNITASTDVLLITELAADITATAGADITIDGAATVLVNASYGSQTLYYNGANYFTID